MSAVIILKVAQERHLKKTNLLLVPKLCVMRPQAQQMLYGCRQCHYLASGRQDAAAHWPGPHISLPPGPSDRQAGGAVYKSSSCVLPGKGACADSAGRASSDSLRIKN